MQKSEWGEKTWRTRRDNYITAHSDKVFYVHDESQERSSARHQSKT